MAPIILPRTIAWNSSGSIDRNTVRPEPLTNPVLISPVCFARRTLDQRAQADQPKISMKTAKPNSTSEKIGRGSSFCNGSPQGPQRDRDLPTTSFHLTDLRRGLLLGHRAGSATGAGRPLAPWTL
jgi:hypothetical protein